MKIYQFNGRDLHLMLGVMSAAAESARLDRDVALLELVEACIATLRAALAEK